MITYIIVQSNRQLKQSSLQALDDVVKKYGTNPKAAELFAATLTEVAPLIRYIKENKEKKINFKAHPIILAMQTCTCHTLLCNCVPASYVWTTNLLWLWWKRSCPRLNSSLDPLSCRVSPSRYLLSFIPFHYYVFNKVLYSLCSNCMLTWWPSAPRLLPFPSRQVSTNSSNLSSPSLLTEARVLRMPLLPSASSPSPLLPKPLYPHYCLSLNVCFPYFLFFFLLRLCMRPSQQALLLTGRRQL